LNYNALIKPLLFKLPPETAHEIGMLALRLGLVRAGTGDNETQELLDEAFGPIERFGLTFRNPLGMAAGFDKNGIVVNQLASLGFGFVEVGTVTFEPQPGNPKPRLFRLPADNALVNRLGFNNDGAAVIAERIKRVDRQCVIGVNIGRNKEVANEDATDNYLKCLDLVHPVADYIVVNVSSPNTPNLRELQKADNLEELLKKLQERNVVLSSSFVRSSNFSWPSVEEPPKGGTPSDGTQNGVPLLVKISPDLTEPEIEAIIDIALRHRLAGIIATNTTVSREGLKTEFVEQSGGLSGKPLTKRSNDVISTIYRHSKGKLPIIGVGGIFTAEDAFDKIASGASLLQAYTGFVYGGPSFARDINIGLAKVLKENGFGSLDDAIGSKFA
jgi:dihydroorotate dehydrogenase